MRPLLHLGALVVLLTASAAHAGAPALLHAPDARPERSLLLVLEAGPDGVAVRDARVTPVRVKTRAAQAAADEPDALLLALTDDTGEPLLVAEVDVPWMLHGPFVGEDGVMHCRGERQERVTFAAKLPLPPGATGLVLAERGATSPTEPADLLRAFRARPSDAGLAVVGGGRLADLPRLAEPAP